MFLSVLAQGATQQQYILGGSEMMLFYTAIKCLLLTEEITIINPEKGASNSARYKTGIPYIV